jgi:class 3 adenylate cyclase/tetratricopeptide (TPR) repeat protein
MATYLKTLVFTDLVDSTAIKTKLAGRDVSEMNRAYLDTIKAPHDARIKADLESMGGRVVNEMGDGFFLEFDQPLTAVRWATGVQRIHQEQAIATPLGQLAVKIGIHIGSPLPNPGNPGDYIGHEVDYAARLCGLAHGDMIVISEATATLVRDLDAADFHVAPHGVHELKGIGRVPVFEVVRNGRVAGTLSTRTPSPNNLPKPPLTFVGREAILENICAQLRVGGVTVLVGEGGMGKTSLALKAAIKACAASDLDGGAAWINCELEPSRDECLRQMARVFFGDRMEQEPIDSCERRVGAHLQKGDALVVLDNFESVARDMELIGWLANQRPPVKVMITSRKRLTELECSHIEVRELPLNDARSLFLERAQRAGATLTGRETLVDAICRVLDGQPLAIELLAPRAALLPLERMLERLEANLGIVAAPSNSNTPDRHRSAKSCVEWSFKELSSSAKNLLQRLCVFPDGVSIGAIKAIMGLQGWDDAAEELVAMSVWRLSGRRYTMHRLVRAVALEQLGDSRRDSEARASAALSRYVCTQAEQARRLGSNPAAVKAAIDWCETELHNLIAVVDFAIEAEDWNSAVDLAAAIFHMFQIRGHWLDAEHLYSRSLIAARRSGDRAREIRALNNLGWIYRKLGRLNDAEGPHRQSIAICREIDNRMEEGHSLKHLGRVLQLRGNYDESLEVCEQALRLLQETGDSVGEAKTLVFLGNVQRFRCEWEEAVRFYEHALEISRRIGDRYDEGEVLHYLGRIHHQQGRWELAKQVLEQSLLIWRAFEDRYNEALILNVLGSVLRDQGRWNEAEPMLRQSLAVAREFHARHEEGSVLLNLAKLDAARGDLSSAADQARESVALLEHTQYQWRLSQAREFVREIQRRSEARVQEDAAEK